MANLKKTNILNNISLKNIKTEKGVIDEILKFTNDNEDLSIKVLDYLGNKFDNKITFKKIFQILEISKYQECDVIINKILDGEDSISLFQQFLTKTNIISSFLIIALHNSIIRIILGLEKNNTIYINIFETINLDEIKALRACFELFISNLIFDSQKDYQLYIDNVNKFQNNNNEKIKKYLKTKVYEIFGDSIKYL